MAMAVTAAAGASVDASCVRFVDARCLRQRQGCGPSVAAFPRGLGLYDVHLKCSRRPQRVLTVRASNKGGPESDDKNKNEGAKGPVDWDKAWERFPKPKKRGPFSFFNFNMDMEQYVNRRPTHSNFPMSEETDPMRKTERQALNAWTDSKFTLAGLGVVVGLFVYMVIIVGPPPS